MHELKSFITDINSFHPRIKFSFKSSDFYEQNIRCFNLDIKPINKQAYIHTTSFHPKRTGKGIIIGEMKQFIRTHSKLKKNTDIRVHGY